MAIGNQSLFNDTLFNGALANVPTLSPFDTTDLVTDGDLSAQESRMPDLARQVRAPGSGRTAYDGKRNLAKDRIANRLRRQGIHPAGLTDPIQLKRAATLLELSLIYRDLGSKSDTIAWEKADYYAEQYEIEMNELELDYDSSLVPARVETKSTISSIPLRLA